jgi:hypothetical protein
MRIIPHFDKIIDYLTKEDLENIQIFTEPSSLRAENDLFLLH